MLRKLFAKLKKSEKETTGEGKDAGEEMADLLNSLKNIFAAELLIDPRIRDFEGTTYGNSCRQRCNNIMEKTTLLTEKIKAHIRQNKNLQEEEEKYTDAVNKIFANLQASSEKLKNILGQTNIDEKEKQLKCYNLGMTVQQSTRALIEEYTNAFNRTRKRNRENTNH